MPYKNYCQSVALIIAVIMLSFTFNVNAQDDADEDGEYDYALKRISKISGFAGPVFNFGPINGDGVTLTGFQGAALINQSFFIGGFKMNPSNSVPFEAMDTTMATPPSEWDMEYGGLLLGSVLSKDNLIHPILALKLGLGKLSASNNGLAVEESIFVVNPQVGAEINITRWARAALTGGYRLTTGFDYENIDSDDLLHSFFIGLDFKFGWFK